MLPILALRPGIRVLACLVSLVLLSGLAAVSMAQDPSNPDCCFYVVGGLVWYDQNANGIMDGGEPPLVGWTVEALDNANNVVGTTTTDGTGNYTFTVPVGCGGIYKLRQVVQSGWNQTFPPSNGWHSGTGTGCSATVLGPYDFGDTQPECPPFQKTYTLDADFNLGSLNGVVTNSDQLELSPTPTTWPFAWVANAGEGTISKVDTQTGNEVARYYTGPPDGFGNYSYLSPSRTVVDKNGNCWVANRNYSAGRPSVTEIVQTGGIDWNANSVVNTSSDANSNGQIDPWEILPWGQDERVIRHYVLGAPSENARGMVIDKGGFLWIGLCTSLNLVKVDPNLPTATYQANMPPSAPPVLATVSTGEIPYGLALSPNGMIYQSTIGPKALQIDPGIASGGTGAGPAVTEYINHGGVNYGIAVDRNCIVWIAYMSGPSNNFGCVRWDPPLTMGNPLAGWTQSGPGAPGVGRGITVDFNNDVWMACDDANNSVVKFSNAVNPPVIGVYPTTAMVPVGVGPSSDGNIIVTPSSGGWCKINSVTGAIMPLPGPQLVGLAPYTYSDFTGSQQSLSGLQQGTWNVITDAGSTQMVWNFIGWNSLTPPSTSVLIEARTAQNLISLSTQSWTTIGSPGLLGTPMPGRYIETRARLQRNIEHCGEPFVTPVLYDLTVKAICDPCAFANCPQDTIIPCMSPQGAEFFYATPVLKSICDSTYTVTCTPPGNFFPIGTTAVQCIAVNATNDTVLCTFNVTVTGNCDPPATGACCIKNFCSILTQQQCELQGGIYFGDNTDCQNGCNRNCVVPPNNLVAWWPLNLSVAGVTPNLAGPATGGTLVNSPAQITGQEVVNSYRFDGVSQYIQVPNNSTLNLGASDFSVDAWVRTTAANGVQTILDKRESTSIQGIAFFLYNGYPALQLAVGNVWSNYILTNVNGGPAAFVADGTWHLVAATVDRDDPAGLQFYVDGLAVGTTFNPTARIGNLNNTQPLYIAHTHPLLGNGFYNGALDEIEIIRREMSAVEIDKLFQSGAAGKCPETCYATQNAVCCNGLASNSSITICNYSLSNHVYSWGVTPINGGAGCAAMGPTGFSPASGTVTVGAQSCVTIPIAIACPSNVPIGQSACYQVSIFNHDTGSLFGCQGSVRRAIKWCWHGLEVDPVVGVGIVDIPTGAARALRFEVRNLGEAGSAPEVLNYMIRPLSGDTGSPSAGVSLNGLPPGEAVVGDVQVSPGEQAVVSLDVAYPDLALIGYDRLVIYGDEDGDGVDEELGEVAVRSVEASLSGVPGDPGTTPAPDGDRRLLLLFPNPFSANDQIRFRVEGDKPAEVKLRLFDLAGRNVKIFYYEQMLDPGDHSVRWTTVDDRGEKLPAGIYFLKLEVEKRSESVKIMVRP